ncbi:MAG: carboxypeptidase-like regulatory domain-containing protein [Candidatus Thermoplasmatota archaeon]
MRAVALLTLMLLAGCTAPESSQDSEAQDDVADAPCIRNVLVDEAIRPVPDAKLTVRETGASTTTDEQGSFCLPLPDGDSTVDVEAGPRRGTVTCHQGGEEPDGCNRIAWTR